MSQVEKIGYVADWNGRLHDKVYEQFKDDPFINGFIDYVLAPQAQDMEDSLQTLRTLRSIEDSEGVQLDMIGRTVGQSRAGVDDATYRLYLRARIIANFSGGTPEELYAVLAAMFGSTAAGLYRYVDGDLASFIMFINPPITAVQARVAISFMGIAKGAGVRGIVAWQEQTDDQTFTCALATWLTASAVMGAQTFQVADTSIFPPEGGVVIIDPGLSTQDTLDFSITDATHIQTSSASFNHDANAAVELQGDAGLGFPAATWVTTQNLMGDTVLVVSAISAAWPSAGSIIIDEGLATEERLQYNKTDSTHLAIVAGALSQIHSVNAAVVLVGSGGSFENAVQA